MCTGQELATPNWTTHFWAAIVAGLLNVDNIWRHHCAVHRLAQHRDRQSSSLSVKLSRRSDGSHHPAVCHHACSG